MGEFLPGEREEKDCLRTHRRTHISETHQVCDEPEAQTDGLVTFPALFFCEFEITFSPDVAAASRLLC